MANATVAAGAVALAIVLGIPQPAPAQAPPVPACGHAKACLEQSLLVADGLCLPEVINPKLLKFLTKKFGKSLALLEKIGNTNKVKKGNRLLKRSRKQVERVGAKSEKFVGKKKAPITPACNGVLQQVVVLILGEFDAGRLGVSFPTGPTGGGGSCSSGRWMMADLSGGPYPDAFTFTPRSDDAVFHVEGFPVVVQGCRSLNPGDPVGCAQVMLLGLNISSAPNVDATLSCDDGFTYLQFDDFSDPANPRSFFATECEINVMGHVSRPELQGTFSGTLNSFVPGERPLTVANGCFSSLTFD